MASKLTNKLYSELSWIQDWAESEYNCVAGAVVDRTLSNRAAELVAIVAVADGRTQMSQIGEMKQKAESAAVEVV